MDSEQRAEPEAVVLQPLPERFESRWRAWDRLARITMGFHLTVGIVAVAAQIFAPLLFRAEHVNWAWAVAGLGAVLTGILTFVKADRAALAYRQAWRRLDRARNLYGCQAVSIRYVVRSIAEGESIIETMQVSPEPSAERDSDTEDEGPAAGPK